MANPFRTSADIKDVARAAGVSITTVSHALNGKGRVRKETRDRVLAEARRLGYSPNRRARGLRSGRSHSLSLVLPSDGEPARHRQLFALDFFQSLTAATVQAAFDLGQAVMLLPPLRSGADLRQFDVDGGIIVDPVSHDYRLDIFAELGLPIVTVGRDLARPAEASWVAADNRANVMAMLDHLEERGARNIALLSVSSEVAWFVDTESAYRDWMESRGLTPWIVLVRLDRSGGPARETATRLLRSDGRPDAIFAPPYWLSTAVMQAARDVGLRVPEDLMVAVGVDSRRAQEDQPPLTAMDLRPDLIAGAAVEMLTARIEGPGAAPPRSVVIPGELRVRDSTGGPDR